MAMQQLHSKLPAPCLASLCMERQPHRHISMLSLTQPWEHQLKLLYNLCKTQPPARIGYHCLFAAALFSCFSFPRRLRALVTCANTQRGGAHSRWPPGTSPPLLRPASGNRWPHNTLAHSYILTTQCVSRNSVATQGACPTCWVDNQGSSSGSEDSSPGRFARDVPTSPREPHSADRSSR